MRVTIRDTKVICFIVLLLAALAPAAQAGIPANYYAAVDASTSATLRTTLNATISTGTSVISFGNSSASFAALGRISRDHVDSRYARMIYSDDTRAIDPNPAVSNGTPASGGWSREHAFPQSFYSNADPMVSDVHMLLPVDADLNAQRNNKPYNNVTTATYTDIFGNRASTSAFEPRDSMKGDVARAIFYMDVRYEGNQGAEPNLTLDDGGGYTTGGNRMGFLSTLLQWHNQDPPEAFEVGRNQNAYNEQRNANPFIDHPEWVATLYGVPQPVVADNDTLTTITSLDVAPALLERGQQHIAMLRLSLAALANEFDLGALDVQLLGSAVDTDVSAVSLWNDRDANGAVTLGDTLLATGPTSAGLATLTPTAPQRLTTATQHLVLSVSVSPTANLTHTLGLRAVANGLRHAPRGGADIDPAFAAIDSGLASLAEPVPTGVNIVMVSTRASSNSATMEFIVLANHSFDAVDLTGWELRSSAGTTLSTRPISGSIPAFQHYIIFAGYTNPGSIEGIAGDLAVPNFFGGLADATGRSIALYDGNTGLANKIDGFSLAGGGVNDTIYKDGNAFAGTMTATSARREVYARKRPAGGNQPYQDTNDNANDLEVLQIAALTGQPKPPPIDATPVAVSTFEIE